MFSVWASASRTCRRGIPSTVFYKQLVSFPEARHQRNVLLQYRSESTSVAVDTSVNTSASTSTSTNTVPSPSPPSQLTQNGDLEPELPQWKTLKGRVSYDTLKAITVRPYKYDRMTQVQAEVLNQLPELIATPDPDDPDPPPRDLLVRARTGTGKTLAFLIPAVEARIKTIEHVGKQAVIDAGLQTDKHLEGRARKAFVRQHAGALIISPTRELATQIANEAIKVTQHQDNMEVRLFVGGMSKRQQMREWMRGRRDIVVGTPGRLRDVLETEPEVARGLAQTPILVLDEADTLLDLGFREDIEAIKKFLPPSPERQTFLFSATVSSAVQQVARSFLAPNHSYINCVSGSDPSPVHAHVPQYHTVLPSAADQIPYLLRLLAHDQLSNPGASKTILFFPTTKMTQLFANILRTVSNQTLPAGRNTRIYELHSKRAQESRSRTSDAFRADKSGASVLVTSDVSARGVDYPGVTRVIQVGIPSGAEQYVHRVGRTGRGGKVGGRGDLVLLPWELGFVTWHLTQVPLKPLTVNELKSQVGDLAAKYDTDPVAFFSSGESDTARTDRYSRRNTPLFPKTPVAPIMDDIDRNVTDMLADLDTVAVEETFMSLLGYYMGKVQELRTRKSAILEGCKNWTVEAMGLDAPPHVSQSMLDRLGFADREPKRSSRPGFRSPSDRQNRSWEQRGHTKRGHFNDSYSARDSVRSRRSYASEGEESDGEGYRGRRADGGYGGGRGNRERENRWSGRGSQKSKGRGSYGS